MTLDFMSYVDIDRDGLDRSLDSIRKYANPDDDLNYLYFMRDAVNARIKAAKKMKKTAYINAAGKTVYYK